MSSAICMVFSTAIKDRMKGNVNRCEAINPKQMLNGDWAVNDDVSREFAAYLASKGITSSDYTVRRLDDSDFPPRNVN